MTVHYLGIVVIHYPMTPLRETRKKAVALHNEFLIRMRNVVERKYGYGSGDFEHLLWEYGKGILTLYKQ